MTRINLLPWRETQQIQKQTHFVLSLFAALLTALLSILVAHFYIQELATHQAKINTQLSTVITQLNADLVNLTKTKQHSQQLSSQIALFVHIHASRPEWVSLLNTIPLLMPQGIYLTRLTQQTQELTFEGKAQANAQVSIFMQALESSAYLQKPKLRVIELIDKQAQGLQEDHLLSDFILTAQQKNVGPPANKSPLK
jgi:type IV pilus assembly protein PilN